MGVLLLEELRTFLPVAADVFFCRFFDGSLALAFEEVEEAEAEEDDEEDDDIGRPCIYYDLTSPSYLFIHYIVDVCLKKSRRLLVNSSKSR